jgi:Zn-dependent protease
MQVALAQNCSTGSQGLQERAAGALWGLSVSEVNSIAIGRGGGVAPLIALSRSEFEDVHETAAGALWNLAFNPGNALRIVEEEGVPALVHLCSSSTSKMARFMAALALAYMFDSRYKCTAPSVPRILMS